MPIENEKRRADYELSPEEKNYYQFTRGISQQAKNSVTALNGYCQIDSMWVNAVKVLKYRDYFDTFLSKQIKNKKQRESLLRKIIFSTDAKKLDAFDKKIDEINDELGNGINNQEQADKILELIKDLDSIYKK